MVTWRTNPINGNRYLPQLKKGFKLEWCMYHSDIKIVRFYLENVVNPLPKQPISLPRYREKRQVDYTVMVSLQTATVASFINFLSVNNLLSRLC